MQSVIIQKTYGPVLVEVIQTFKLNFSQNLHSIYIYGSVAKGTANIGRSDLDLCIIFNHQPADQEKIIADIEAKLMQQFPFLPKIDFDIGCLKDILNQHNQVSWGAWLKFFCKQIYGEDLSSHFKDIEINLQVIQAINAGYEKEIAQYLDILQHKTKSETEMLIIKNALIKRMIRLLPLTLQNIDEWPLSLAKTIQQAIQTYPEQQNDFQYLLNQLDNVSQPDSILVKNLSDIYLWIENRLSQI